MQSNRDTILSDFVRKLIREWEATGRQQKGLADRAGFAKSTVAQVKKGTGVGAKTAPGFAKAFGYPDVETMVDAAYEWRRDSGEALERLLSDPEVSAAVEHVRGFQPWVTEAQVRAILSAYVHPRFHGRERSWWMSTLLAEVQRDVQTASVELASNRAAKSKEAARVRSERGAWGSAAAEKRRLR